MYSSQPSVKQFREIKRQHAVLKGAGDHNLFVLWNYGYPGILAAAGDLLDRNSPARGNISIIIDTPNGPAVHRVGQDQSLFGVDGNLPAAESSGLGSSNDSQGFGVALGSAIENQQAIALHHQQVVHGIHGNLRSGVPDLRIGAGKYSFWSDISVPHTIEYQYAFGSARPGASISTGADRKKYLVVRWIGGDSAESGIAHAKDLRFRSLNDANRSFFSVDGSAESQNGLRQRAIHNDFVVDRIVGKTMHGPAEQRFLTLDRSYRRLILLRLPGEGRNLRMGHSVRHPDLIPPFVVRQRLHFAEFQRDLI